MLFPWDDDYASGDVPKNVPEDTTSLEQGKPQSQDLMTGITTPTTVEPPSLFDSLSPMFPESKSPLPTGIAPTPTASLPPLAPEEQKAVSSLDERFRSRQFHEEKKAAEALPAPERSLGGEVVASVGRGLLNAGSDVLLKAPSWIFGDVLRIPGVKDLFAQPIQNVEMAKVSPEFRPGSKAGGPPIDLERIVTNPEGVWAGIKEVVGQTADNVTNAYFWASQAPEQVGSLLSIAAWSKGFSTLATMISKAGPALATAAKASQADLLWTQATMTGTRAGLEAAIKAKNYAEVGKIGTALAGDLGVGVHAATMGAEFAKVAQITNQLQRYSKIGMYGGAIMVEAMQGLQALDEYEQEHGTSSSWGTRVMAPLLTGLIAGPMEAFSLDKIIGMFKGGAGVKITKDILNGLLTEGITETMQTIAENAVEKYGFNPDKKLLEGVVEAALLGAAMGGVGGGTGGIVSHRRGKLQNALHQAWIEEQQQAGATPGYGPQQPPGSVPSYGPQQESSLPGSGPSQAGELAQYGPQQPYSDVVSRSGVPVRTNISEVPAPNAISQFGPLELGGALDYGTGGQTYAPFSPSATVPERTATHPKEIVSPMGSTSSMGIEAMDRSPVGGRLPAGLVPGRQSPAGAMRELPPEEKEIQNIRESMLNFRVNDPTSPRVPLTWNEISTMATGEFVGRPATVREIEQTAGNRAAYQNADNIPALPWDHVERLIADNPNISLTDLHTIANIQADRIVNGVQPIPIEYFLTGPNPETGLPAVRSTSQAPPKMTAPPMGVTGAVPIAAAQTPAKAVTGLGTGVDRAIANRLVGGMAAAPNVGPQLSPLGPEAQAPDYGPTIPENVNQLTSPVTPAGLASRDQTADLVKLGQMPPGIAPPKTDASVSPVEATSPPTPTPTIPQNIELGAPHTQIAAAISQSLTDGVKLNNKDFFAIADNAFKGTQAAGVYTPKDAYDAMELGVNQYILNNAEHFNPTVNDIPQMQQAGAELRRLTQLLPTQANRTDEQDKFQQFSTPPELGLAANWAGNIQSGEVYLEPSAGNGGLAVFGKIAGARVIVNELASRRAENLKLLGFDQVFTENAEQLNNILPKEIRANVVVMNPPFSATAGRMGNQNKSINVVAHIDQALKRLEPGGRLVAIVGRGMTDTAPTFKKFWADIKANYNVLANVGVSGKNYAKYGTSFDNRILIIDNTGPTMMPPVMGDVANIEELYPLLKEVRDARVPVSSNTGTQPTAAKPTVPAGTKTNEAVPGPDGTVVPPVNEVGTGEQQNKPGRTGTTAEPSTGSVRQPGAVQPPGSNERLPGDSGRRPASGIPNRTSGIGLGTVRGATQPPVGDNARVSNSGINVDTDVQDVATESLNPDAVYETYRPQKIKITGAQPHPGKLVESAAMASVAPTTPTYQPQLPAEVIKTGKLSEVQLEAIVYAGQSHQTTLPNGERKGFFIGDGTGVGKGREIVGIIWDNFSQGRKKAVWVSINKGLFKDAKRDVKGTGWDESLVADHSKTKANADIKMSEGILFTSYDTLKSGAAKTKPGEAPKTRLDQIVNWLGEDFDGVIAFDESHQMGNAVDQRGLRGTKKASARALAGLELQRRLPNARVVYVSATGATEVMNLAYATRLGLWGEGTAFADRNQFITQISSGGVAAMECVARDMKAMGVYLARSLDYRDVGYDRLEHPLTPDQIEIYDELAEGWQLVLNNIEAALELTKNKGRAAGQALGQFWGANQRFFNQVITSMQMPSVLTHMEGEIAKGNSVIVQLVNTNEASQERAIGSMTEDTELDELDLTPRDALMQYIQRGFPTQQYEEQLDDNGNTIYVPVFDSEGNPVENAEAVAMRDALLERLGSIRVPQGPLEMIINKFGVDQVGEVTGRKRRIVPGFDENGNPATVLESRSPAKTDADVDAFMDDKKQVLIFSDRGGTGRSYHADLDAKNQRHRVHYLVQPGWRADRAVQGLGRSHRTNQASAPTYVLCTTNIQGQKRFLSSIARRLDQLGALTKGQRQTGSGGFFSARDNLESTHAKDALDKFLVKIVRGQAESVTSEEFEKQTGLKLVNSQSNITNQLPEQRQFLNRLLSMSFDTQNAVFEEYSQELDNVLRDAEQRGTLDVGMETIQAKRLTMVSEKTVHIDPNGAETKYIEIDKTEDAKVIPWEKKPYGEVFRNTSSGKVWSVAPKAFDTTNADGSITSNKFAWSPTGTMRSISLSDIRDLKKWERLQDKTAQELWTQQFDEAPKEKTERMHIISGAILPIWDRLQGSHPRIVRVETFDTSNPPKIVRLIGRVIPTKNIDSTLKRLGVESTTTAMTAEESFNRVLDDNYVLTLSNGWKIQRSRVSSNDRIEVVANNLTASDFNILKQQGAFTERIGFQTRVFIPTTDNGISILERITASKPVMDATPRAGSTLAIRVKGEPSETQQSDRGNNAAQWQQNIAEDEAAGRRFFEAVKASVVADREAFGAALDNAEHFPELQAGLSRGTVALLNKHGVLFVGVKGAEVDGLYHVVNGMPVVVVDSLQSRGDLDVVTRHELLHHLMQQNHEAAVRLTQGVDYQTGAFQAYKTLINEARAELGLSPLTAAEMAEEFAADYFAGLEDFFYKGKTYSLADGFINSKDAHDAVKAIGGQTVAQQAAAATEANTGRGSMALRIPFFGKPKQPVAQPTRGAYKKLNPTTYIAPRPEGWKAPWQALKEIFAAENVSQWAKKSHSILVKHMGLAARVMAQKNEILREYRKDFDALSKPEFLDFMDAAENGMPIPKAFSPRLQEAVDKWRVISNEMHAEIKNRTGGFFDYVTDYMSRLYKRPEEAEKALQAVRQAQQIQNTVKGGASLTGTEDFRKARTVDFMSVALTPLGEKRTINGITYDGLGFESRFPNYVDSMVNNVHEKLRFIMGVDMFEEWRKEGLIVRYKPNRAPTGWVELTDKKFQVWHYSKKGGGRVKTMSYYAPTDVARIINNYLSPGMRGNALYDAYRNPVSFINSIRVGLSAFHACFTIVSDLSHGVGSNLAAAFESAIHGRFSDAAKDLKDLAKVFNVVGSLKNASNLYETYLKSAPGTDVVSILSAGGMRVGATPLSEMSIAMSDTWRSVKTPEGFAKIPHAIMEGISWPIMGWLVPRAKLNATYRMFMKEMEKHTRAGRSLTTEQQIELAQEVVKNIDNIFGQLVYDNVSLSRWMKDTMHVFVGFPGWNIGSSRTMAGTGRAIGHLGKEGAKAVKGLLTGKGVNYTPMDIQAKFGLEKTVGMMAVVSLLGALTQLLMAGKSPEDPYDLFFPQTGNKLPNGQPERVRWPSYIRDYLGMGLHPYETVKGKLNWPFHIFAAMADNVDYAGRQVHDPEADFFTRRKQDLAYILKSMAPFSVQGYQRARSGGAAALSLFGLTPAPKAFSNTEAANVIDRYYGVAIARTLTPKQVKVHDMKMELMDLLREGNKAEFKKSSQEYLKSGQLTHNQVKEVIKQSSKPSLVTRFERMPLDWELKALEVANPQERKAWEPILMKKVANAQVETIVGLKDRLVPALKDMGAAAMADRVKRMKVPESANRDLIEKAGLPAGIAPALRKREADIAIAGLLDKKIAPKEEKFIAPSIRTEETKKERLRSVGLP